MASYTQYGTGNGEGRKQGIRVEIPERVIKFAEEKEMQIVQINSQRTLGPSLHVTKGWEPEEGSEVFVGKISRDYLEPELVPFLEKVGPFHRLRLMMDFSGTNKGFCFVQYFSPEQAEVAISTLHHTNINSHNRVVACKSVDNKRLVMSGFPISKSEEEILEALKEATGGIVQIDVTWVVVKRGFQKGIAFVTYQSHRVAALARKKLLNKPLVLCDCKITTEWAEPPPPFRSYRHLEQVLLVQGLHYKTPLKTLWETFNSGGFSGVTDIRIFRAQQQAFVYFSSRAEAEVAKVGLDGLILNRAKIQVGWFDPHKIPRIIIHKPRIEQPKSGNEEPGSHSDEGTAPATITYYEQAPVNQIQQHDGVESIGMIGGADEWYPQCRDPVDIQGGGCQGLLCYGVMCNMQHHQFLSQPNASYEGGTWDLQRNWTIIDTTQVVPKPEPSPQSSNEESYSSSAEEYSSSPPTYNENQQHTGLEANGMIEGSGNGYYQYQNFVEIQGCGGDQGTTSDFQGNWSIIDTTAPEQIAEVEPEPTTAPEPIFGLELVPTTQFPKELCNFTGSYNYQLIPVDINEMGEVRVGGVLVGTFLEMEYLENGKVNVHYQMLPVPVINQGQVDLPVFTPSNLIVSDENCVACNFIKRMMDPAQQFNQGYLGHNGIVNNQSYIVPIWNDNCVGDLSKQFVHF